MSHSATKHPPTGIDLTVILEVKVTFNIADDDPGRIDDMVRSTIGRMEHLAKALSPEIECIGTKTEPG